MQLKVKLGDILIIAIIVLTAIIMTVSFHEKNTIAKTAVITQNNVVLDEIRLDRVTDRYVLDYSGQYPGTIEAVNGKIRFLHAQCPDQVCVHTGWISRTGQIAVCLPAGVVVKIEGADSDTDIDIIVK